MATYEREASTPPDQQEQTTANEPIEAIEMPDGTIQPTHPMALKGLAESIHNGMPIETAAAMYGAWDPKLPKNVIYKHLKS